MIIFQLILMTRYKWSSTTLYISLLFNWAFTWRRVFVVKQIAQGENKLFDRPSVEIYIFGRSQLHNPQTNSSTSKWWFQLILKSISQIDQIGSFPSIG